MIADIQNFLRVFFMSEPFRNRNILLGSIFLFAHLALTASFRNGRLASTWRTRRFFCYAQDLDNRKHIFSLVRGLKAYLNRTVDNKPELLLTSKFLTIHLQGVGPCHLNPKGYQIWVKIFVNAKMTTSTKAYAKSPSYNQSIDIRL